MPQHPLQTASQLLHSLEQRRQRAVLPTRIAPFDRLQGGGLARGSFVELVGVRSSGRFALMTAALAAATRAGEAAALIDLGDHLDPRSAESAGVDLKRVLWVRPRSLKEALMSAEMVLAAGFSLVALDLGSGPIPLHRVPPSAWTRLGRAAEAHGGILLLLSPTPVRTAETWSTVTVSGARGVWQGHGDEPRLLAGIASRLTAVRRRGGHFEGTDLLTLWAEGV